MKEEKLFVPEHEKNSFDVRNLAFIEHLMIGSSTDANINGSKRLITSESLGELQKDKKAMMTIFTPINLERGTKNLHEVSEARRKGSMPCAFMLLFDHELVYKFMQENIMFDFNPGKLDQNGQIDILKVSLLRDGKKISLPKQMPLSKNFANYFEQVGINSEAIKVRAIKKI